MNALGGKHPILYCTWRKNPEERRVSDGSALTDPDQRETRRCLQHSIKIGRHRELEALTSGGLPGGAIYYLEQETGGLSVTLMCKQLRGIHCGPASTLMINHSAFFACLAILTSDCTAQLIHQTHRGVA